MIKTVMLTIIIFTILFSGCKKEENKDVPIDNKQEDLLTIQGRTENGYVSIGQDVAKEIIDQGNVTILDVRTKDEYDAGHIPGAILIPHDTIKAQAESIIEDKEATILVYCRSGNRSKIASEALGELGYKSIYEFGGINTWEYEIVGD